MKQATLVIIPERGNVLMGEKKTGEIGQNLFNAPGGKIEPGESPIACALRETWEELGIRLIPQFMEEMAVITFYSAGVPDFLVYVYRAGGFAGTPRETEAMIPRRFHWNELPYERMHDGDAHWFELVRKGAPRRQVQCLCVLSRTGEGIRTHRVPSFYRVPVMNPADYRGVHRTLRVCC